MRNLALLLVLFGSVALFTGCVMPMASPVFAPIMADIKGPLMMGDSDVECTKTGMAEATGIILFSSGDASISAAMEAGGITKVHHVDFKAMSILGLYTKWETIVYGE
jgi:hypothetical protein